MKISISGIRGIYGKDFFPEDVMKFCDGFSTMIRTGKCVIARDTRPTGMMISNIVSATLLERGIDVHDLGMVPTPVAFKEAKKNGEES